MPSSHLALACGLLLPGCAALPPNPVDVQQARIEAQCFTQSAGGLTFRTDLTPCAWQACYERRADFCAAWPEACE